jgi:hypothetical protein
MGTRLAMPSNRTLSILQRGWRLQESQGATGGSPSVLVLKAASHPEGDGPHLTLRRPVAGHQLPHDWFSEQVIQAWFAETVHGFLHRWLTRDQVRHANDRTLTQHMVYFV